MAPVLVAADGFSSLCQRQQMVPTLEMDGSSSLRQQRRLDHLWRRRQTPLPLSLMVATGLLWFLLFIFTSFFYHSFFNFCIVSFQFFSK